jgi:hypothetical protein
VVNNRFLDIGCKETLTPETSSGQAPTLSLRKGEGVLFYKFPLLFEERNKVRSLLKNIKKTE